jgi:acetyl-CoA carboxylase beta subunit
VNRKKHEGIPERTKDCKEATEMIPDYDDDYAAEAHLDRKEREGWTRCADCGEWIHREDFEEGATCTCDEEGKPPLAASSRIWPSKEYKKGNP